MSRSNEPAGVLPDSCYKDIHELISAGQPTSAFEMARQALAHNPDDANLEYLRVMALARGGNIVHADKYIKRLLQRADLDARLRIDALSLSARLCKGLYARAAETSSSVGHARRSADLYSTAYRISHDPFPGINAATMELLAGGDAEKAKLLASEVLSIAKKRADESTDDYWARATIGEAYLLLGETDSACPTNRDCAQYWYRAAVDSAGSNFGDVAAMRRQVRLLSKVLDVPDDLAEILSGGRVAVFSGHMIDHPDRLHSAQTARFPIDAELEQRLSAEIDQIIEQLDIREGFVSAACGSDLLFAERLMAHGRRAHIILPFALDDFYRHSVDFGQTDDYWQQWRTRCDAVLAKAGEDVHYATAERYTGGNVEFRFVNRIIQGLALQRAEELDVTPWAIVVRDAASGISRGGTKDFLGEWIAKGDSFEQNLKQIDLAGLRHKTASSPTPEHSQTVATPANPGGTPADGLGGSVQPVLRSMLFADVNGFSALREEQTKIFFIHFLDRVARLIEASSEKPVFQNTWGDGLFFVFKKPEVCARFALSLVDIAAESDLESLGLPKDLAVRVGIHTGPVFVLKDPIIDKNNVFGAHVNRAARIEPVTIPGCVYASKQMTAVLADSQPSDLTLEYIGVADLAKDYDQCPLYRVTRR